jgi:phosphatidylglycerol:prolipoprotein diacylglycerol transferase
MSEELFFAAPRSLAGFDPGMVWAAALLAASAHAVYSAWRAGLSTRAMYWAVVCSLLGGLWGANLLSLLVHGWDGGPLAAFEFVPGGKSLFGGLFVGGFAGWLYFHYRKLPFLAYADAAVPSLAMGYAIGRLGCFLNGDDYGSLTHARWAVVFPPGTEAYQDHLNRAWISPADPWSLPIHPVQLYASLLGLVLFVLLANWRPKWEGGGLCTYLVLYGVGRFSLEYFRGDFRRVLGPLSAPQLFSIFFMLAGVSIWAYQKKAPARNASFATGEAGSCQWQRL